MIVFAGGEYHATTQCWKREKMSKVNRDITVTWSDQNAEGRLMAEQFIKQLREKNAPNLLGQVVRELIDKQQYGGVQVGFFHKISLELMN